ncbi:hypothetical protein TWF679_008756 [Orbilia oligospora]|uniref:SWIRM domain-containing protein n=1 Tax=Orbilia oligospora TaxID=2813651 RepID=A0A8H8V4A7_ORBOL|nr:hypothetical protein TWF679_008756 [Orbilia oligospora]
MVLDCRPIGARNSSGSRFSHGFFTPEEKHSKTDYIGAFADGLIRRRDRRATKDDMCINLSSSQFGAARIIIEDDGSTCSRSSSRTGDSERTSHTSSSIEQELPGGTYSPPVTVHRGRTVSYPTPQPMSKPQTPIRNVKMQRFPSLSGVDLTNLPPTPDSLRATPLFGSGLDMNKRRREPSPEIPSAEDIESEAEVDHHSNLEGEEEVGLEGDEWEDVEEDEDGEIDDGDSVRYETASGDYEDDMEDNNFMIGEEDVDVDDDYDNEGEEEEEEGQEFQEQEGDRQLHLDGVIPPYNKNTDEDLDEDGAYTPKLRAKLEASPQIRKTDKGLSLSSSIERQNPKKSAIPQARSCIPENPAEFRDYAQECVWAADAARLNPWNLHEGEYEVLRGHLNQLHVTTYLNIRNGILRLWLKNSKTRVTVGEAMGCCKEERFFGLAEVAFNWLTRSGYINHGCLEMPISSLAKKPGTRRRKTIAIIGAGISGLAAARQLEALLASSGERLGGSGVPDVVVFEGRHRLGGRVFSATLTPGPHNLPDGLEPAVDIGGQIVMGYDARNPLAALIVDQLGIPFHTIGRVFPIHDHDGKVIGDGRDTVIELVHNDILRRLSKFSYKEPPPQTAHGDVEYITKCKDPWGVGGPPLAEVQGEGHVAPPIPLAERGREKKETRKLRKALEGLNIKVAKAYNEDGLACLGRTMEKVLPGYSNLLKTDARDLRLFNWFQANLEYGNAVEVNGSSLEHWDQDDGNEPAGAHTMIMGGYSELAKGLSSTPSELDVRLNHVVTRIKYDPKNSEKKVVLQFADGQTFEADKVIVTLPLGVLKREHGVDFVPPLPEAKQDAIKRLGFGLLNKVIMVYKEAFWDTNNAGFGCLRKAEEGQDEDLLSSYEKKRGRFYIWWNTTDAVGRPTLVGLMVGDAAEQVEGEDPEEIIKEATGILKKCWGEDKVPDRPEEIFVTKWRKDPFALGSYSYVAPGSTGADYDTIAEPINDQIFFAGEHTSRKYPATVHGAYISGLRVAGEVAEAMLGPIQVPTPLIGPRVLKSRTEAVVETTTIRTSSVAGARGTKSTNIQITKTTKDQRATIASRRSTTSTVVRQKTKRKASDEDEYRDLAKRARTNSSRAETSQQKRKRQVAYEPELEARPIKKPRVPSVQAGPQQNCVPTDPKPEEPRKETANPFLIYQKDFFKIAQSRANHTKREQTGTADAKADRNEVRVVLGDMWRGAAPETKNRYQDQANQNKRNNLAKINDHKRQVVAWELRQVTNTRATVAPAPISSSPAPISSAVYPTPADTTPSVDDRETIL